MNNEIVVIYKEVGKDAILKKIKNDIVILENLVGGKLDYLPYDEIIIIARKDRKKLKPNIYINTKFLSIGESIRGNIVIASKEKDTFKSLTKDQAIKYRKFLARESFNYDNFDEYGRLIIKNNKLKNNYNSIFENEIDNLKITSNYSTSISNIDSKETLKMILGIQTAILKYIKNIKN